MTMLETLLLADFSERDGSLDLAGLKIALRGFFNLDDNVFGPIFDTARELIYGEVERSKYSADCFVPLVLYTEKLVKLYRRLG